MPTTKKKTSRKPAAASKKKAVKKITPPKPIGVITHFYTAIKVAIIKCKQPLRVGTTVALRGATTNFTQKITSMQYDHAPVKLAKKGQEIGVKVSKRVREGDEVFIP